MKFRENFRFAYWLFGLIVVILMIVLGLFLLFSDYFDYIQWSLRIAFGLFLLSLGAFRIVNILLKLKRQKDEDENEEE
jgi:uncharacterized membrane protein HdeD (DUF308 family)